MLMAEEAGKAAVGPVIETNLVQESEQKEKDMYLAQAEASIAAAQTLGLDSVKSLESKQQEARSIQIGPEQVSWIPKEERVSLVELRSPSGKPFLWGDITPLNRQTRKYFPQNQDKP